MICNHLILCNIWTTHFGPKSRIPATMKQFFLEKLEHFSRSHFQNTRARPHPACPGSSWPLPPQSLCQGRRIRRKPKNFRVDWCWPFPPRRPGRWNKKFPKVSCELVFFWVLASLDWSFLGGGDEWLVDHWWLVLRLVSFKMEGVRWYFLKAERMRSDEKWSLDAVGVNSPEMGDKEKSLYILYIMYIL